MFGSKPTFGGSASSAFGQNTSLFGTSTRTQPQASTNLFAQPTLNLGAGTATTRNNVFGASQTNTIGWGSGASSMVPSGTTTNFQPMTTVDSINRNGQAIPANAKLMCISAMNCYQNKSLEELRLEDYAANRQKGPSAGIGNTGAASSSLFGGGGASTSTANQLTFGGVAQQQPQQTGLFGQPIKPTTFGTAFGQQTAFGQPAQQQQQGTLFGTAPAQPTGFGFSQTNQSFLGAAAGANRPMTFGTPAASTSNVFGQQSTASSTGLLFGGAAAQQNPTLFGQQQAQTGLTFGATQPQQTGFGGTTGTTLFGVPKTTASVFGAAPVLGASTQQPNALNFGAKTTAPSTAAFGGGGLFGTAATGASTGFGAASASTGLFGQPQQQSIFGQAAAVKPFGFGTATASTAAPTAFGFGQQQSAAPTTAFGFGTATGFKPATSTTGLFGTAANTGGLFGGASQSTAAAGQTAFGGFGGTTALGQTGFGGVSTGLQQSTGLFGSTAPTAFGATGQPTNGLLGQTAASASNTDQQAVQQVLDLVRSLPYGQSRLFRYQNMPPTSTATSSETVVCASRGSSKEAALFKPTTRAPRGWGSTGHDVLRELERRPNPVHRRPQQFHVANRSRLFSGFYNEPDQRSVVSPGQSPDLNQSASGFFVPRRRPLKDDWKRLQLPDSVRSAIIDRSASQGLTNLSLTVDDGDENDQPSRDSHKIEDSSSSPAVVIAKPGFTMSAGDRPSSSNERRFTSGDSIDLTTRDVAGHNIPQGRVDSAKEGQDNKPPTTPKGASAGSSLHRARLAFHNDKSVINNDSPNTTTPLRPAADGGRDSTNRNNLNWANATFAGDESILTSPDAAAASRLETPPSESIVRLTKPGYYILPAPQELTSFVDPVSGRCIVEDFVIGRLHYGNILFPGQTDVTGLNLDDLVSIRRREVVIYPDDSVKPPQGTGLNKKAEICMEGIWPTDKSSREPIKSPKRLSDIHFSDRLERATSRMGARFIEYRPETGSWVFEVKHFSKYRLDDDDEDSDVDEGGDSDVASQPLHQSSGLPPLPNLASMIATESDKSLLTASFNHKLLDATLTHEPLFARPARSIGGDVSTTTLQPEFFRNEKAAGLFDKSDYYNDYPLFPKPVVSSYFRPSELISTSKLEKPSPTVEEMSPLGDRDWSDEDNLSDGTSSPILDVDPFSSQKELLSRSRRFLLDASLFSGQSSRASVAFLRSTAVGAGSNMELLMFASTQPLDDTASFDCVENGRLTLHNLPGLACELTDEHLLNTALSTSCHLPISTSPLGQPNCTLYSPIGDGSLDVLLTYARVLCLTDNIDSSNFQSNRQLHLTPRMAALRRLVGLCMALWCPDDDGPANNDALNCLARKQAVSEWIRSNSADWLEARLRRLDLLNLLTTSSTLKITDASLDCLAEGLFACLVAGEPSLACQLAINASLPQLASLIAQVGSPGDPAARCELTHQLMAWRAMKSDRCVPISLLRLFALLAGQTHFTHPTKSVEVNVLEGLAWANAFGAYLWYLTPYTYSLGDVLREYSLGWHVSCPPSSSALPRPLPPTLNDLLVEDDDYDGVSTMPSDFPESGQRQQDANSPTLLHTKQVSRAWPRDTAYHLLQLHSSRLHSLERTLDPIGLLSTLESSRPDPLCLSDWAPSWHLWRLLHSLGYQHTASPSTVERLCSQLASQLESAGMWEWAVFVLQHLPECQSSVKALLGRQVALLVTPSQAKSVDWWYTLTAADSTTDMMTEAERFVVERLGLPSEWVHEAKAILAQNRLSSLLNTSPATKTTSGGSSMWGQLTEPLSRSGRQMTLLAVKHWLASTNQWRSAQRLCLDLLIPDLLLTHSSSSYWQNNLIGSSPLSMTQLGQRLNGLTEPFIRLIGNDDIDPAMHIYALFAQLLLSADRLTVLCRRQHQQPSRQLADDQQSGQMETSSCDEEDDLERPASKLTQAINQLTRQLTQMTDLLTKTVSIDIRDNESLVNKVIKTEIAVVCAELISTYIASTSGVIDDDLELDPNGVSELRLRLVKMSSSLLLPNDYRLKVIRQLAQDQLTACVN